MLELAAHPNIVGVKQAVGALDADTLEILAGAPADFSVLGGDDPFFFPTVLMGGAGCISAAAHLCTERFVAMIECGLAGKVDDGRAHAEALFAGRPGRLRRAQPRRCSRVCCTPRGASPRPTCGSRCSRRRPGAVERALAAVARAS